MASGGAQLGSESTLRDDSLRPWMLVVLIFALALRLLYLQGHLPGFDARQSPVFGDASNYYSSALYLTGLTRSEPTWNWYSRDLEAGWDRSDTTRIMASHGPGYPLFLAASFKVFGEGSWPVRYLQAVLGSLTCVIVLLFGRSLAGLRVGVIAGLLCAIYPTYILFGGRLLSEVLSSFLFWLGVLLLVRALRGKGLVWFVAAGLFCSAAMLTRATLLVTIPFLLLVAVVPPAARAWRKRLIVVVVFGAALAAPLIAWNGILAVLDTGEVATVGGGGVELVLGFLREATAPNHLGWQPDVPSPPRWDGVISSRPYYPVVAAANLVFYHLWFLDNIWREISTGFYDVQRAIALLALGGLGLGLLRWRSLAPALLLWAALTGLSIKWIWIRHAMPFAPVLFLFAAIFLTAIIERVSVSPNAGRARAILAAAVPCTAVAIWLTRFERLAPMLPDLSPFTVGVASDVVVITLGFAWYLGATRLLVGRTAGRTERWIGLVSALIFVLLYGSYAYIGSEPRWRAWELPVDRSSGALVQRIELARPVPTASIRSGRWLVDLRSNAEPSALQVGVNGEWLEPGQYRWRRLACGGPEASSNFWCMIYSESMSPFTRAFPTSPQWWGIEIDASFFGDRSQVSLELRRRSDTRASPDEHFFLGGNFDVENPRRAYGPSPLAIELGPKSSIYRWHVARDWRIWETTPLKSARSISRAAGRPVSDAGPRPSDFESYLIDEINRGRARFHIRFELTLQSGHTVLLF